MKQVHTGYYICKEEKDCIYKNCMDKICNYLSINLGEYFLYHLGEEPSTSCEEPFQSTKEEIVNIHEDHSNDSDEQVV